MVPIAGDYTAGPGWPLDPHFTRLKNSDSHADADKEGLRLELNGGRYPFEGKEKGKKQKAFVEFLCDEDRTGLEGDEEDGKDTEKEEGGKGGDSSDQRRKPKRDEDDDDDGKKKDEDEKSLRFKSYKPEGDKDVGVLRLEWRTKYACESSYGNQPGSSSHWGFFTWFMIM